MSISIVYGLTNSILLVVKEAHLIVASVGNCISCDACAHVSCDELFVCMSSLYSDVCIDTAGTQNKILVKKHIEQQGSLPVWSFKPFLIGPSRVGKTTARRRLTEEISNVSSDKIIHCTGIETHPLTVKLNLLTEQSSLLLSTGQCSQGLEERLICET